MSETRKLAAILVADVVGYSRLAGTDEERIYHSAGTRSGQYVDDREFRRLIEEAGWVPVRRNSTYDEFAWDWTPEALAVPVPS